MKNKLLVYDDNCPLCSWYSGLFVKFRLLEKEGRVAFSTLQPSLLSSIDLDKSRNEIPLLDTSTGKVLYGIDALLEILGQKFSLVRKTGNIRPVKWCLKKFYKFISYNRKVIVAKKCGTGSINCSPDMNYFYRLLFLGASLLFNTLMLFPLHQYVFKELSYYHLSAAGLQEAHFGLVLSNCLLALGFKKDKAFEYLGQVNMLALTAMLLMMPLLLLSSVTIPEWVTTLYLVVTTIFIIKEYLRRMDYAGVLMNNKWVVSINWSCLAGFIFFVFH